MSMTDAPTLEQVLRMARRLPPADQARLAAHLSSALATALAETTPMPAADDPWATLARIREDLRALGPVSPSATEELIASRR